MGKHTTIAFFYYSFYPVTGGASVHGYNIAKELSKRGYRIIKINGKKDPYTEKKSGIWGFLYTLFVADIVFVRLDFFLKPRNVIPVIAKLFGKKVIAELNSPSDELYLHGYSDTYRSIMEWAVQFIIRCVDKIIAVSKPMKRFSETVLKHDDIVVIENGGEIFYESTVRVSDSFKQKIDKIRERYSRLIIWSGTPNKMQESDQLSKLGSCLYDDHALIIMTKTYFKPFENAVRFKNVYVFSELTRDEVKYITIKADVGLALYGSYDWCRWGFYNSSLKLYEYLCNSLVVITNKNELLDISKQVLLLNGTASISDIVQKSKKLTASKLSVRTWEQVGNELENQIEELIQR